MNRRMLAVLLGVAALAVTIQNVIFFRSLSSPPAEAEDAFDEELAEQGEFAEQPELAPISYATAVEYLDTLSSPEVPRSPFLTRAEAMDLAGHPFYPPAGTGDPRAQPNLAGTLWSPDRRVAWIDGVPRSEGDEITGYRLERIEAGSVLLVRAGEEVRLLPGAGLDAVAPHGEGDDES